MVNAGRVLIIPKGDYNPNETYTMLDLVTYEGSSYVAKETTRGNLPTDTTYWQQAAKGANVVNTLKNFAPFETTDTATHPYVVDDFLVDKDESLKRVTAAISPGDTIADNTNVTNTSVAEIVKALEASISTINDSIDAIDTQLDTIDTQIDTLETAVGKTYKSDDAAETEIEDTDYIPFYDTSDGAMKKILVSDAEFAGGGSTINLDTGDDGLYGKNVTITDGTSIITGKFSDEGKCTFEGVQLVGTLTISATVGATTVMDTLSVPYFGIYNKAFGREAKTISIYTEEATLKGKTVTATYNDTKTRTATISSTGEATIAIYGYTGEVMISASDGTHTAWSGVTLTSAIDEYQVTLAITPVYGVYWDGSSSPAMTRTYDAENFSDPVPQMSDGNGGWTTGSSPFDNLLPWSGMQIVEDANAGTLVSIPKYYYRWTKVGTAMTLQIANSPLYGFHVSPAHADRGDGHGERDVVYVGRYHCASDGTYKSTSGKDVVLNVERSVARTNIHNLGSDIWQYDYAMWWTIGMLYLVEFANWNCKEMIGYGCSDVDEVASPVGHTDNMTYHTGTDRTSLTTYGFIQYRHIEGLWDTVYDYLDGCYYNQKKLYIINNPANFSDTDGGVYVGGDEYSGGANIKTWDIPSVQGLEWALYVSEGVYPDFSTYVCAGHRYAASNPVIIAGYCNGWGENSSLFTHFGFQESYGNLFGDRGARLMKLPNS